MFSNAVSTRLAGVMAGLILIFVIVVMVGVISFGVFTQSMANLVPEDSPYKLDLSEMTLTLQASHFAVTVFPTAFSCWGFLGLRRTFLEASVGRTFSTAAVSGLRRFAFVSLVIVFIDAVFDPAATAILAQADPEGSAAFAVEFGADEAGALFNTLMIFFVCHVFVLAKRTQDENDAFI